MIEKLQLKRICMKRKVFIYIILSIFIVVLIRIVLHYKNNRTVIEKEPISPLIRCDDIGMSHAVNMAVKELIKTGIPFSTSVMFVCPWYQEAVEILREHPEISIGIHLTLNAEWKNYRWGPVTGRDAVPSLVDSCGYFFPSRKKFFENNPKIDEVEHELRAQIERALQSGLQVYYLDYHMSTAVDTPEFRALVEQLAKEYGLGISRYLGEMDVESIYNVPIKYKSDSLLTIINRLEPGPTNLMVFHIGMETPEMNALIDLNSFGLSQMSRHRHTELKALCSRNFRNNIKKNNIQLITYRELISTVGLENMKFEENNIHP